MQRARSFLYVSLGILALALAYHFGATTATAQTPSNPVVAESGVSGQASVAVTANGDVYVTSDPSANTPWRFVQNIFAGATPSAQKSWGQVKVDHR